jgi:hypothetical protein
MRKKKQGATLTAVWTPEAMKEMEADFERHASQAVVVSRSPDPCLASTCPVIDLFTRERIR